MKTRKMKNVWLLIGCMGLLSLSSCNDDDSAYVLQKEDIQVVQPEGGFVANIDQLFRIEVTSVNDENISYQWSVDGEQVSVLKNFEYIFEKGGEYVVTLKAIQGELSYEYTFNVKVEFEDVETVVPEGATAYITKVLDYLPAVGQFVNTLPKYEEGNTQEDMNQKVLDAIGNNKRGMITLGGFGGYVVVGFDHTIVNRSGLRDFRVLGNSFFAAANPDVNAPEGGSCEPGVIMVAYDQNKNGVPDENEWYEIAGSAYNDALSEPWYEKAVKAGNDVNTYHNYEITYYRPESEPNPPYDDYIRWTDNLGNSGYKVKNIYHSQSYYPQWVDSDNITFKGTCLPQNAVDESGQGTYYVLYKFQYGYADNDLNTTDGSAIDIDWAVNDKGQKVHLPGVDFVKVYTGVNQENGWLGECSTEILGVEDLHVLGLEITSFE